MSHTEKNVLPSGMKKTAIQQRERASARRLRLAEKAKRAEATLTVTGIDPFPESARDLFPQEESDRLFKGPSLVDTLRNKGRTDPQRGVLGEVFIEAPQAIGRTAAQLARAASNYPGSATVRRSYQRLADYPTLDAGNLLNVVGFGEIVEETEEVQVSSASGDSQVAQIHTAVAATEARIKENEALIETLDGQSSDPTVRAAAQQVIEEKEVEIAQMENDLLRLQDKLSIQDVITQVAIDQTGLADALDLKPLEEALAIDGGLGSESYEAILALADNAALSEAERNEGIDIVLARSIFSQEIILKINDMVENKANLEEFILRPDYELLDNPAAFLRPQFNFNVTGENDAERFESNLKNTFDLEIEIPDTIPEDHFSFGLFEEVVDLVMQHGVDVDEVATLIGQLSTEWQIEETDIYQALKLARGTAQDDKKQWDDVLDADSAVPGSKGMVAAIYQAGEEIGFDPQLLEMASMSEALHALIDTQSQGVSGKRGEGTIAGIGGLTLEMYKALMPNGEEWTPTRGMKWELEALLEYIRQVHGGDALRAVNFWRDTGEWGGTESLPGQSPIPGSRADLQAGG